MTWVLGIGASHNGAACLANSDGGLVAIQEERLSRRSKDRVYLDRTSLAVDYCLQTLAVEPDRVDLVAGCTQRPMSLPENDLAAHPTLGRRPHLVLPHHRGHALHAAAASGFREAAVLVIDGLGSPADDLSREEADLLDPARSGSVWESISIYHWRSGALRPLLKQGVADGAWLTYRGQGMPGFGTLGGLYAACARRVFADTGAAGKVMGLAAYGHPKIPASSWLSLNEHGIDLHDDIVTRFDTLAPWPHNEHDHADLAASVQRALETAVLHLARLARDLTGCTRLCYSGGVALNGLANERLIRESGFVDGVYITPAAEDNGTALGAAIAGFAHLGLETPIRGLNHDFLGRSYRSRSTVSTHPALPPVSTARRLPEVARAADMLARSRVGAVFSGAAEFGPRALGGRSIVADPRDARLADRINRELKGREPFRPFAPAVLEDHVEEWFETDGHLVASPYMLRVMRFRADRARLVPAVVHADGTGRLQTVTPSLGPLYELISAFHARTGVPMLLNTSFNVADEPIVESPEDALWCLAETPLAFCLFDDALIEKNDPASFAASFDVLELLPVARLMRDDMQSGGQLVEQAWGPVAHTLSAETLALLRLCDGTRTGHDLAAASDHQALTHTVTESLLRLRRAGLITFTKKEGANDALEHAARTA